MDRLTLPAAAMTVAAIIALCPAAALADTSVVAAASDSEAVAAMNTAPAEPAPAAVDAGASVGATSAEPATEPPVDTLPAESGTSQEVETTPAESTPATTTQPAEPETVPASDPTPVTPVAGTETVDDVVSFVVIQPESHVSSSEAAERHVTAAPASPPVIAAPLTALSGAEAVKAPLESVLPKIKRELRKVESQINDLRRRIDHGEPAPALSLIRLSLTLAELAPALMALDGRLEAAGLTPGLEREVRRLQARLAGTQASAAGLLVDLRRSEAYGFELGMLMRELESFGALELGSVAPRAELAPARAPSAVELPAAPPQAAPTVSRSVADAPPPTRVAGENTGVRSPDFVGSDEPATPSAGSGSASPGGAFSAAGVAALAVLLIGLAFSLLSAALPAAPSRSYSVMFLSPLERPG